MAMKLLTQQIRNKLPRENKIKNLEGDEMTVVVKFFHQLSNSSWYAISGDEMPNGDMEFFGFTSNPDGIEWGYFWLSQLEEGKVERDKFFKPSIASDVLEGLVK